MPFVLVCAPLFALVNALAYSIRFDGALPAYARALLAATCAWIVAVKLVAFLLAGCHRGSWRYLTFDDLIRLVAATTLGAAVIALASALPDIGGRIPRSVIVLDWAATILVMGVLRGGARLFREFRQARMAREKATRVLIVGATETGVLLARAFQFGQGLGLSVAGFLDPDRSLHGVTLSGVPVVGGLGDARDAAALHRAQRILVPSSALTPAELRRLHVVCSEADLTVQIVPGVDELLSGNVVVKPRDVDLHDLLCRQPVQLDDAAVRRFLCGRVVLVTGAAGSIGAEICRRVLAFEPARLVLLDHSENGLFHLENELRAGPSPAPRAVCLASITDERRLRAVFSEHRPDVVFHAAAHKHVPLVEANPGEALRNNVLGTRTLVDVAIQAGADAFVMISTDKAVNPTSVMGACKRVAEMYVQSLSGRVAMRLSTVRFGNVLGSNGSVVPLFQEQIRRGGPITVTHPEMARYFMTIGEAAQLVLQAGAQGRGGEIFVLDMGPPIKIRELARDLIRLSGSRGIEIVYTGLRPGEKLHEELYHPRETRRATSHPKIFLAQHRPCAPEALIAELDALVQTPVLAPAEVVMRLRALVPEYRPGSTAPRPDGACPTPAARSPSENGVVDAPGAAEAQGAAHMGALAAVVAAPITQPPIRNPA